MPKRKMKNDLHLRFELQDSERNALDLLAASKAFNNVATGVGSVLTPLSGAMTAIVSAWIAKEGIESLHGAATRLADRMVGEQVRDLTEAYKQSTSNKLDTAKQIIQDAKNEGRDLTEQEQEMVNDLTKKQSLEEYTYERTKFSIVQGFRFFLGLDRPGGPDEIIKF